MLKQIFLRDLKYKKSNLLHKLNQNFLGSNTNKFFCTKNNPTENLEKINEPTEDNKSNEKKFLPLLVEDPFMPYGCNLRYIKNEYLQKIHSLSKESNRNLIAFYFDKKKQKISNFGVECSINYYDASGEIVITSINADRRIKANTPLPLTDMESSQNENLKEKNIEKNSENSGKNSDNFSEKYENFTEENFLEIRDNPEIQKNLNFEVCKNIVSDINKVLYAFLEISSRQNSMDNPILREIHGNVSIMIQNLLKQNMDFLMEISKPEIKRNGFNFTEEPKEENKEKNLSEKSENLSEKILSENPENNSAFNFNMKKNTGSNSSNSSNNSTKKFDSKEFYPEGMSRLNKLIFKTFQDFLKISKSFKKSSPVVDVEEILKSPDPFLRTKLLIENIYNLGDYILKELHIYEEYKKDSAQKHEKFFLRFAKKYVEQVAGTENFDDYKKKLDQWELDGVLSQDTRRAIDLELKQAFSTGSNDMEMEEKKKTAIVEEIFNFPWDKRDEIEFDTKFTKEIFAKNLYGMETVKERIFEYVAKLKRTQKDNKKGFVILISGSPGVGKTTVAQLIGQALKRKTGLINLAGENDTIKLKGSRRTYVDSQPSKFFLIF